MSKHAAVIAFVVAGCLTSPWTATAAQRGSRTVRVDPTVRQPGVARISGSVITRDEPPRPVRRATVRARNAEGRIVGTTITDDAGEFAFTLDRGGTHYVELVDDSGRVLAVEDVGEAAVTVELGFNSTTILRVPARLPAGAWNNTARTILGAAGAAGIGAFVPAGQPASPEK
jgi:hypothetical protein